jgi:hypothetical protein
MISETVITGNRKNLDHLSSCRFEIIPLAYIMSTVFISRLYMSWVRWSYDKSKYTNFTFTEITEDGKTYFHIFSADYPDY